MQKQDAVTIYDLSVSYHDKRVLWDIDLEIPKGKLVAIVGPNGAGKTTLLKTVLDVIPKVAGQVFIHGKSFKEHKHLVGYVPQRESVDWDFPTTVLDVVTMGTYGSLGWFHRPGAKEKGKAVHALGLVGMSDYADRQIGQLSGGQQQRVFLARALAQEAQVYFMDEPFAGVDAVTEKAIIDILRTLQQQGKTVIVVHHDLATVPEYFDWVTLLNVRIVASGTLKEVFTKENLEKTYKGKISFLNDYFNT